MKPLKNLLLAACLVSTAALAQAPLPKVGDFPSQPLKFISPFPPGGGNDAHARFITMTLPAVVGQSVIAENKGGAGGNIGAKFVADAKPDGYTLLVSQTSIMAINPVIYSHAGFDALKDYVPVTQINSQPLVMVVNAQSKFKTFDDLRKAAAADPSKVTYASPGNGTMSHLLGVVLNKECGVAINHVPYKGAAAAVTDLVGGQVDSLITSPASVQGMVEAGKLRAVALTAPKLEGTFKGVPTLEQMGCKGLLFEDWYGVFAPAGTPPERVQYLAKAIGAVLRSPDVARKIRDAGGEVVANSPEEFARVSREDIARWTRFAKLSGAKVD